MKIPIFLTSLFLLNSFAFSKQNKETVASKNIHEVVLQKYSNAKGFKVKFSKTDHKKTLSVKNTSSGVLNYSNGKLNILIEGDKKSEIIFNGKKLWVIDYPDADFDPKGARKVTEISDHKPALATQLVSLFKSPESTASNFKITKSDAEGKYVTLEYQPKDKALRNFKVIFNVSKNLIHKIQFVDDVQTETTIEFVETEFLKKAQKRIFEYKKIKTDEVM